MGALIRRMGTQRNGITEMFHASVNKEEIVGKYPKCLDGSYPNKVSELSWPGLPTPWQGHFLSPGAGMVPFPGSVSCSQEEKGR